VECYIDNLNLINPGTVIILLVVSLALHSNEIIDLTSVNVETFYLLLARSAITSIIALSSGSARPISLLLTDGRRRTECHLIATVYSNAWDAKLQPLLIQRDTNIGIHVHVSAVKDFNGVGVDFIGCTRSEGNHDGGHEIGREWKASHAC